MILRRHADSPEGVAGKTSAYQMREKMFTIGDDFWIEDGAGRRAFQVDGKALRLRKTLIVKDAAGNERFKVQDKLMHIRDTMEIEGPTGKVATVKRAMISPLRERFSVDHASGANWNVQGNIVDHEYEIEGPAGKVADVSKKWFRVRDTYGISVAPGQDDALVLAVVIVVDQLSHPH